MIKYCPRCGERNRGREPICAKCGQKLYGLLAGGAERMNCLVCSTPNPATAIFCTGCGRRHSDPVPEPEPPPPLPDLMPLPASSDVLVVGGASGGGGGPGRALVDVPPTVRAASGAAEASMGAVEISPQHRLIGCGGAVVGALVFVALFALLFRQTQQALLAEIAAPTLRPTEALALGQRPPDGVVIGGGGAPSRGAAATPAANAAVPPNGSNAARPGQAGQSGARDAGGSATSSAAGSGASAGSGGGAGSSAGSVAPPGASAGAPAGAGPSAGGAAGPEAAGGGQPASSGAQAAPAGSVAVGPSVVQTGPSPGTAPPGPSSASAPSSARSVAEAPGGSQPAPTLPSRQTATLRLQIDDLTAPTALPDRQAAAGHRFVVAAVTIENLSLAAVPIDGAAAQLVAGDGTTYRSLAGLPGTLAAGSLPPGRKASGRIVFDVPVRRDLTLRYGGVDIDLSAALP